MYDYEIIEKDVVDDCIKTNDKVLKQCNRTIERHEVKGWELIAFIHSAKNPNTNSLVGNYTLIFQKELDL